MRKGALSANAISIANADNDAHDHITADADAMEGSDIHDRGAAHTTKMKNQGPWKGEDRPARGFVFEMVGAAMPGEHQTATVNGNGGRQPQKKPGSFQASTVQDIQGARMKAAPAEKRKTRDGGTSSDSD